MFTFTIHGHDDNNQDTTGTLPSAGPVTCPRGGCVRRVNLTTDTPGTLGTGTSAEAVATQFADTGAKLIDSRTRPT